MDFALSNMHFECTTPLLPNKNPNELDFYSLRMWMKPAKCREGIRESWRNFEWCIMYIGYRTVFSYIYVHGNWTLSKLYMYQFFLIKPYIHILPYFVYKTLIEYPSHVTNIIFDDIMQPIYRLLSCSTSFSYTTVVCVCSLCLVYKCRMALGYFQSEPSGYTYEVL